MGLGLLLLVSVSKENLYLSGQPEITFFKLVYKQYTNFSIETIPQYFKTEPDFSRKTTINISKNADLLHNIYLFVKLPSIPSCIHSYLPSGIKKFRWIDKIGLGMIKSVDVEIGGVLIDRLNGEYLNFYHELYLENGLDRGYDNMIGNLDDIKKFTNGKPSYELQIPLKFWFCQDSGLSLPLISLTHNDVKIHVEFERVNKCYIESPTHYITINDNFCLFNENELIKQEIQGNIAIGRFIYFDPNEKRLYYDKISNDFQIPTIASTRYNIVGMDTQFEAVLMTTSIVVKDESYFKYSSPSIETSYILADYIYLDNKERWEFIHKELEYLIPLIDNLPERKFFSTNVSYKIDLLNNPTKILYWRAMLLSNYESNDVFNYTIYPLDLESLKIISNSTIIINSIEREENNDVDFYQKMEIYKHKMSSPQSGIMVYSFTLYPNEYQPASSFNFNKAEDAYIQFKLNKLVNYQNPVLIKAYAVHYNVLRIIDGLGSLVFYS
tara:strand:+ start:3176 stop:4663 length:1488 start_codon:yes stop_codon:yes gene_type:complete